MAGLRVETVTTYQLAADVTAAMAFARAVDSGSAPWLQQAFPASAVVPVTAMLDGVLVSPLAAAPPPRRPPPALRPPPPRTPPVLPARRPPAPRTRPPPVRKPPPPLRRPPPPSQRVDPQWVLGFVISRVWAGNAVCQEVLQVKRCHESRSGDQLTHTLPPSPIRHDPQALQALTPAAAAGRPPLRRRLHGLLAQGRRRHRGERRARQVPQLGPSLCALPLAASLERAARAGRQVPAAARAGLPLLTGRPRSAPCNFRGSLILASFVLCLPDLTA